MPIYEYECSGCGVVEAWQGINDKQLTRCPECKRRKVKKLISDTSFQLKGTGWYVTDYGSKNNGNGKEKTEDSNTSEKSAETKDTAKTDKTDKTTKTKETTSSTSSTSPSTS